MVLVPSSGTVEGPSWTATRQSLYELTRFYILEDFNLQQDRQCTHIVTMWLFRVTSVAVETQQWILCPPQTFSHKRHDFRKKFIESEMCVSIFSTIFV
jgi:hypothetical protein